MRSWRSSRNSPPLSLPVGPTGDCSRCDSETTTLRQNDFTRLAILRLTTARSLTSLGLLESSRGNTPAAITALRKSVELDPNNLIAVYKLAEEVERQGDDKSAEEFQSLIQKILTAQPDNLAALVELSRVAAKRGDAETFKSSVAKVVARSSAWPEEVREQVNAVDALAKSGDLRGGATRTSFLRNVLMRVPEYRRNLAVIKPPPGEEAIPFAHFLKLESPVFITAPADTSITFKAEPVAPLDTSTSEWIGAISLSGEGAPVIATANQRQVDLANGTALRFPGMKEISSEIPGPMNDAILPVDFNYDFKTDLVLAGADGLRFIRQDSPTAFTDVTSETKLPDAILRGSYKKAWSIDIEADGDLDIVLGGWRRPAPVLRNNGDGTFTETQPFTKISAITGFALGGSGCRWRSGCGRYRRQGVLHVFSNERQGQFSERAIPSAGSPVEALKVMDVDNDGVFDLVVCDSAGYIFRYSDKDQDGLGAFRDRQNAPGARVSTVDLKIADLDNNGGLDLVATIWRLAEREPCKPNCNAVWLNDGNGKFDLLQNSLSDGPVFDIADVNNDGRLDLLVISDGRPLQAINQSKKNYHWQIVRPRPVTLSAISG